MVDVPVRGVWHVWRNRRYLSLYKLLNMAVVNCEFFRHRERLRGLPYVVKVEPTNICNTRCQLCPTGLGLNGRAKGKMSLDQFRGVIDQIRSHAYVVDLSNWGDPLIVPEIFEMIRYAHEAGTWTYISSNLHAFDIERGDAEALVRSGLDMLNCSLHGASQSTYELYQPGKRLDVIVEKIKAIQEAKARLGSRTPVVQLFFVVMKHNEHEIEAFRSLAEELGCEAVFTTASLNLRFVGCDKNLNDQGWSGDQKRAAVEALKSKWLPTRREWVSPWYRGGKEISAGGNSRCVKANRCDWPWRSVVINWDGGVTVCCGDYNPRWEVGNIFKQPLKVIWNNPAYLAARRSFTQTLTDEGTLGEPCRSCSGVLK
jgi:radical SAM protein with 4Fe4S-binding SPASM domain